VNSSRELDRLVIENMPDGLFRSIVENMLAAYQTARDSVYEGYDEEDGRDLFPYVVRANLEGRLRAVARQHNGSAETIKNSRGNSHVRCGFGLITFTACGVSMPKELPRKALSRVSYLQQSQLEFFEPTPLPPTTEKPLYGILIHGPRDAASPVPQFIGLGFPKEDWSAYEDYIPLDKAMKDLGLADPEELIEDRAIRLIQEQGRRKSGDA